MDICTESGRSVPAADRPRRALASSGREPADVWRTALHEALPGHRIVDGATAHGPADDAWSYGGMEACATASAVLSLCALP